MSQCHVICYNCLTLYHANCAFKCGMPSQKWWTLVKKRHGQLTRRKPEGTASIRHKQMNKVYVGRYFTALMDVLDKQNLHEMNDRIWNMDETGMVLEHRPTKVLARRGARYLQSRTSGNQKSVTVIVIVSSFLTAHQHKIGHFSAITWC